MPQQYAELQLSADIDDDGTDEDATFVLAGDLEIRPLIQPDFLVGGRGSTISSLGSEVIGDGTGRQGYYLDFGGGVAGAEIAFRSWEGASADIDDDGTEEDLQWGNTGDPSTDTVGDTTGADPITQISTLYQYLIVGTVDSRNTATLSYGEFSSSGLYSPQNVVLANLDLSRVADDGSWFDGELTLYEARTFSGSIDAVKRKLG